jgi:hypothetical protein
MAYRTEKLACFASDRSVINARHLPHGRSRAGDRHLNFYETRDNLARMGGSTSGFRRLCTCRKRLNRFGTLLLFQASDFTATGGGRAAGHGRDFFRGTGPAEH